MIRHRTRSAAVVTALLAASFVTAAPADGAPARTAPAQSTKVLPDFQAMASAVDSAGGSLVAGVTEELTDSDGLFLYHRSPSGTWAKGQRVPLPHGQLPLGITDVKAIAGTDGFYVVTWMYAPDEANVAVWSATRLPSGTITGPRKLFDTASEAPLRMAGNADGDAAVTQLDASHAARYVRGTGWTTMDTATDEDGAAGPRSGAIVMISPARTVDLTFRSRIGDRDHFIELTRTTNEVAFVRHDIYTAPDDANAAYGIAMDAQGLQTLVTNDADDAVKIYREVTRRGPFVYRWRKAKGTGDGNVRRPYVASAGRFTRVTWYATQSDGTTMHTRLLDGTSWESTRSTTGPFGDGGAVSTPMVIGNDGRGVEIGLRPGAPDADITVDRGLLERTTRSDVVLTTKLDGDTPALDVGPTGVSQIVIQEITRHGDDHPTRRTLAVVRR